MSRAGIGRVLGCLLCLLLGSMVARGQEQAGKPRALVLAGIGWEEWSDCVRLRFSERLEMGQKQLEQFVETEPAVANLRVCRAWDDTCLDVYGDWVAESTYKISVKPGLRSRQGAVLKRAGSLRVRVPRMAPLIGLLGRGIFYPLSRKELLLPVHLRNLCELEVEGLRIHEENLVPYDLSDYRGEWLTTSLGRKTYKVSMVSNRNEEFQVDLSGVLPVGKPGLYMVSMKGKDNEDGGRGRWASLPTAYFVITDLGLAACHDPVGRELAVSVRRLGDNSAVEGASVSVYSQKNLLIRSGKSDGEGLFRFSYDSRFEGDNSPRFAVVRRDGDCSFIEFRRHGSRTSRYFSRKAVADRSQPGGRMLGPQAFVYWERGAVRPGESASVSAFVRQREARSLPVLADFPCVLRLLDPMGREVSKVKVKTDAHGYVSHEFRFEAGAATGAYAVECGIDGGLVLGQSTVLVATYVPDRLKVELETDRQVVRPGESFTATCRGRYYYGAPARQASGVFRSQEGPSHIPSHWKGYAVGGLGEPAGSLRQIRVPFAVLGESQQLTQRIPEDYRPGTPMTVLVSATLLEPGGRGVTRTRSVLVDSCGWYLGLRHGESEDSRDLIVRYRALALSEKEKVTVPAGTQAVVSLKRITWDYVQVKRDGAYELDWVCERQPFGKDMAFDVSAGEGTLRIPDVPEGHYAVEVRAGRDRGTLVECWHYYGEGGRRSSDPLRLNFVTDREEYRPGDTAEISFEATGEGYGLVAFGEAGMQDVQTMPVRDGKNSFKVTIPAWVPTGAYSGLVTVVTGTDPHCRLFGHVALKVNQSAHRLRVRLSAPEVCRPEQEAEIAVSLSDVSGAPVSGVAQVFLVDSGVLSLTAFKTPDIFSGFHRGQPSRLECTDLYDLIYPELKLAGSRRIGGDGIFGRLRQKFGDTEQDKTAVVYLRPVAVGQDGKAVVKVRLPKLLGSMRIMCVASSPDRVGSGEREVVVRDHLGVQGSCPRAVVPGDEFECVFTLNNFSLDDGDYAFSIEVPRDVKALGTTVFKGRLKRGVPITHSLRCRGTERLGATSLTGRLIMGGSQASDTVRLTLRSMNPPVSTSETVMVQGGGEAVFSVSSQAWLSGSCRGELSVGTVPATGIGDGLAWLNNYPFGCLEQTVACVLPLLNLDQLVASRVVTPEEVPTYRDKLETFTARIRTMYLGSGGFALWPGSRHQNDAASVFAANFLFELNRQRPLEESLIREIRSSFLEALAENASHAPAFRGYVCYVLSLLDQAEVNGDTTGTVAALNLIAEGKVCFGSMLACAALVRSGRAADGMPLFRRCLAAEVWRESGAPTSYCDLAARLGMTLKLVMDIMPDDPMATRLAKELSLCLRKDGLGWGTTQANAWATYALSSYVARHGGGEASGTVELGAGRRVALGKGGLGRWPMREGDSFTVRNTGKSTLFVTCRKSGVPRGAMAAVDGALSIRRTYLNLDGQPVTSVRQGELLQVRIDVESLCNVSDLVVVDLLPGGLEIEDSRLATRATVVPRKRRNPSQGVLAPTFVERRDDRLVLFGDLWRRGRGSYTYQVRAVSRGRYGIPPVTVEAMYAPDLRAVGVCAGTLEVK